MKDLREMIADARKELARASRPLTPEEQDEEHHKVAVNELEGFILRRLGIVVSNELCMEVAWISRGPVAILKYEDFDAARGFGRLEMLSGDTSTGLLGRLLALNNDHPITPDRIRQLHALLIQAAQKQRNDLPQRRELLYIPDALIKGFGGCPK